MSQPTTRVLALLEMLQAREVTGGAELARALEVDRRTLRRYIVMLEELGIPIVTTQGALRRLPGGTRFQTTADDFFR